MTEGTAPVPHIAPSLTAMMTYYPGFIAFRGATTAGVEPSERLIFLTISYENP
jgi:hypothetical protein